MNTATIQPSKKRGAIRMATESSQIDVNTKERLSPYQRTQTLRQSYFWSSYINKDLETFGNAYKSAISAGYTDDSARNITTKDWYRHGDNFHKELLEKAERNISEVLDMDITEEIIYRGKKTGERRINPNLARIRLEISTFILSTLGKSIYSKK